VEQRVGRAIRVRDHPHHETGCLHLTKSRARARIGAVEETGGRVVAALEGHRGFDLPGIGEPEAVHEIRRVLILGRPTFRGDAAGEVGVETHPGAELRLLDRLHRHRVASACEVPSDGRIVHAKEGVAGIEQDGADSRAGGSYHRPIIMT
jgi:hypothetical protein